MPPRGLVSAPASSANIGPGFDSLALAITRRFEVSTTARDGFRLTEGRHPARRAFEAAGGEGELWWSSRIPPGRGQGFSGAAAVAGAFAAGVDRDEAFRVAVEIEGHADNAAASTYGGLCVTDGRSVVSLPMPSGVGVAVWWPDASTSTSASRRQLPESVPLADAAANIGHACLLVAAVAVGRLDLLSNAPVDRLHEPSRLDRAPASAAAAASFRALGATAVWLSGSGPSVAALIDDEHAAAFAKAAVPGGIVGVFAVDSDGVKGLD